MARLFFLLYPLPMKPIKVLFQSRSDLFTKRGGDTVQIEQTKQALEKLGVAVSIDFSTNLDLSNYDLVHLFNIDWCRDTYLQAVNAKKQNKSIVLSAIHHSFADIDYFAANSQYGLGRIINPTFRKWHQREFLKSIYRVVFDPKKLKTTLVQLGIGTLVQQKSLLEMADVVVVQTDDEIKDIKKEFGVPDITFKKVVNGVRADFATATSDWCVSEYGLENFVFCVGRIEPRKNQLAVIDAFQQAGLVGKTKLVFVGKVNRVLQPEYSFRFKKALEKFDWVKHIPYVSYENIGSMFASAKVHILASWFETTGLVSLDAGLAGANVVSPRSRCQEYLGDYAYYCDPSNVESIAKALKQAYEDPRQTELKTRILENYTWDIVGRQTLDIYKSVCL